MIPEIEWVPIELDGDIITVLFLGTLLVTNYYPERFIGWGAVSAPLVHHFAAMWWRRRNKQEGK